MTGRTTKRRTIERGWVSSDPSFDKGLIKSYFPIADNRKAGVLEGAAAFFENVCALSRFCSDQQERDFFEPPFAYKCFPLMTMALPTPSPEPAPTHTQVLPRTAKPIVMKSEIPGTNWFQEIPLKWQKIPLR